MRWKVAHATGQTLSRQSRKQATCSILTRPVSEISRSLGTYSAMSETPIPPATPLSPTTTKAFPFKPSDFTPSDTQSAAVFYTSPRFVTHIDDPAIAGLRAYYEHCLPSNPNARILDLCSSWVSHFPPVLEAKAKSGSLWVGGIGMNAAELARNTLLKSWEVRDLDAEPNVSRSGLLRGASGKDVRDSSESLKEEEKVDASTLVVSIDYLRRPVSVLSSLRQATRQGGTVHIVLSNRCFPTKAVHGWLERNEPERVAFVGDLLWWSGWRNIESVVVRDGFGGGVGGKDGKTFDAEAEKEEVEKSQNGDNRLKSLMQSLGFHPPDGTDPLWVVRATNTGEKETAVPEDV